MKTRFKQLDERAAAMGLWLQRHDKERPKYELTVVKKGGKTDFEPFSLSWHSTMDDVEEALDDYQIDNKVKSSSSFTTDGIGRSTSDIVTGRFANGWVAVHWQQGRYKFAYLYDKNGNQVGHQYGDSKLSFWTTWTFPVKGTDFIFSIIGGTKRTPDKTPKPKLVPGDILTPGTKVWNAARNEYGIVQGKSGEYRGEAGNSDRVRIQWAEGKFTRPAVASILFKAGKWVIGG